MSHVAQTLKKLLIMNKVPVLLTIVLLLLTNARKILANHFTCLSGNSIGAGEICDGIANCADSSDERRELCAPTICQADQFKCYYGACISRQKFCNKRADCVDGSDEFNCGKSNESCEWVFESFSVTFTDVEHFDLSVHTNFVVTNLEAVLTLH